MREPPGDYRPASRVSRSRPPRERRSRVLAVIVLIVAAIVLLIGGLSLRSSDSGGVSGKATTPFSILPIAPQNLDGSSGSSAAGTDNGAAVTDSPTSTSVLSQAPLGEGEAVSVSGTGAVGPLAVVGGDAGEMSSTGPMFLKAGGSALGRNSSSLMAAAAVASAADVPVLMYHYVGDVPPPSGPFASNLTVRTGDFEDQMRYLADNRYQTVGLGDLYLAKLGLKSLPPRSVILTFDDGGLDNYQVAFPILVKNGLRATFFVITDKVGAAGQMDWDDLRVMADQGMSIESHTVSHPLDLRTLDDDGLARELGDSKAAIAEKLGLTPESLSYPSGKYDQRVIAAAKAAGYLTAVGTNSGSDVGADANFEIRRIRVLAFESTEDFSSSLR